MAKIEDYLAKAQEMQDKEAFKKICKAFTKNEWEIVLSTVPSSFLANELVRRAEMGGEAIKKMKEVYDSVWN